MPQYRDPKDYNEDSDSSDGTNPGTPRKTGGQGAPVAAAFKQTGTASGSPAASPNKPVQPSPKRTLFSRPSKMNISTAPKDVPGPLHAKETKELISPPSPLHYFSANVDGAQMSHSSSTSSFSALLKHAGTHVPHPHLHHSSKGASGIGSTGNTNQATFRDGSRGRSFDMLRVPSSVPESGSSTTTMLPSSQPISPSFFASGASATLSGGGGRGVSATGVSSSSGEDDSWPLICARVLPLFNGEGLRQPIEDLNRLVSHHLSRVTERGERHHVVEDVAELFETGIRSLDNHLAHLPDEKLIHRLSEIWVFFFSTVLPYLEATFLPLTMELSSAAAAAAYLPTREAGTGGNSSAGVQAPGAAGVTTTTTTEEKRRGEPAVSVHAIATKSYRDILILPLHARLATILAQFPLMLGQQEIFGRLLQCISVLRRVQSNDARQRKCDELGSAVLFRRAKGRGDRRGIIGQKASIETGAME